MLKSEKIKLNVPAKGEQAQKIKTGRRSAEAPTFPRDSLSKTLALAKAIEDQNAGKPYDRLDLAKATDLSPNSSGFRQLITSGGRYGITEGSYAAATISLTSVGSAIVAPTESNIGPYLRQALLKPELFDKVFTFYDKKQIPRIELFKNSLKKQFGVVPEDVDACYNVMMENIKDYGLANDIKGNQFLQLDKLGSSLSQIIVQEEPQGEELAPSTVETIVPEEKAVTQPVIKQIFIAHGKNKKPLDQLQKILDQFGVKYKVAINEPNKGRPISSKVAELMKVCTSAIFIFTADEKTQDAEGNVKYRPSDNVVYELGAASALYDNKIVIFKEESVDFASDFSDIGYISFEKDNLGAKTMELMKELIEFKILQITPT